MPVYAVTGASGQVGHYAVQPLLARGVLASDVAVVHTRGKAAGLAAAGVRVREADYLRPEALGAALADVDRLLLVSSSEVGQLAARHINVIAAAGAPRLSRILLQTATSIRRQLACFKWGTDVWSGRGRGGGDERAS